MICRYCGAELEDGTKICTQCGKDLQEPDQMPAEETPAPVQTVYIEKPKAKTNIWMYVAITACCALGVLLGFLIWQGMRPDAGTATTAPTVDTQTVTPTTGPAAEIPTPEELGITIEGFMNAATYTVDETTGLANADNAITTVGQYTLNNSMLQTFYWRCFTDFVSSVVESGADPLADYQLDISKPLNEQRVLGSDVTWEQYFLHQAITMWWQYAAVNAMADEAGFELDEEVRKALDDEMAALEEQAAKDGFANGEELVKARLGMICDVADFRTYMELTTRADAYNLHYQENYVPTEQEVAAFYETNFDYYSYYGITKDAGKGAAVRHILLKPGETDDPSTGLPVATEEQWEACRVKAEELYAQWQAGEATEESFGELAKTNSADGSASNGGLYEDVITGQMVEAFDGWLFDASRKPGDTGIVKTEFGYHIMYFVSMSEQDAWYTRAYKDAISYNYGFNNAFSAYLESNPLKPALEQIKVLDISQDIDLEGSTGATTPTTAE